MVTLSSMALLTACSSHKESSSADKTPKSSQVTSSVRLKHPVKIAVRLASLVLRSRNLRVQRWSLQARKVVKRLLPQVRVVVRLSHHLPIVHQLPQAVSHRLLNLQTRINLQPVNLKLRRTQVIVKLQALNLAVKLKLKNRYASDPCGYGCECGSAWSV